MRAAAPTTTTTPWLPLLGMAALAAVVLQSWRTARLDQEARRVEQARSEQVAEQILRQAPA
ncbi:MAG: hypothetical protein ACK58X_21325 [Planctomycetota bacterium]